MATEACTHRQGGCCCRCLASPRGRSLLLLIAALLIAAALPAQALAAENPQVHPGSVVLPADPKQSKEFPDGYMAICAVAKDQSDDIREWVEYHM
jgi:hypothetical protein